MLFKSLGKLLYMFTPLCKTKFAAVFVHTRDKAIQTKCEVIEKYSQGASDGRCQGVFVYKYCMLRGQSLSGNILISLILRCDCFIFNTETNCISSASCAWAFCFQFLICSLSPQPHVLCALIGFITSEASVGDEAACAGREKKLHQI